MAAIPTADRPTTVGHAPKSSTRNRFMKATGLDVVERVDKEGVAALFEIMEQMCEQRHREIATRENTRPEKKAKDPFTFDAIRPEVIQNALEDIYRSAPVEVRSWFDHWQSSGPGRGTKFWYIEWFLYKRFRHTDWRNQNTRRKTSLPRAQPITVSLETSSTVPTISSMQRTVYDPVRDQYTNDILNELVTKRSKL